MLFGIFFVIIEAKQLDMKTILRNFFSVLRRFKTASVLNVLGLSIAFVAFMLIMMQVNYDYTFDRSHRNADAIFGWISCTEAKGRKPLSAVRSRGRLPSLRLL